MIRQHVHHETLKIENINTHYVTVQLKPQLLLVSIVLTRMEFPPPQKKNTDCRIFSYLSVKQLLPDCTHLFKLFTTT